VRQIVMNMQGTVVARMPRPIVQPGTVLVRVHYSLVSVGTEIAPLRPAHIASPDTTALDRAVDRAKLAQHYFKASLRDPQKAARRVSQIVARRLARTTAAPASGNSEPSASADHLAQGWAIGYSAAGEVVEVGSGVSDLAPGDLVACAGAGLANHADFTVVPRNLVCRVPAGCDVREACSATLGAIALQGVRRASPQLGERICVLGLGLIGQITVQLLRAAGCTVIGLDLDPARVSRAHEFGLDAGATTPEELKSAIRDLTGGHGADATLMTAATKSDSVINLAMDVTRPKGKVVIVGDVGLGAERTQFYRKEIDLLMSTSYGPGRYDAAYEVEGRDYPYGYVRWTLNRNLQSYLELIAAGKVSFARLIDRELSVEEAPAVYDQLAKAEGPLPLGVVISYMGVAPDSAEGTRIALGGSRKAPADRVRYAVVGPGAFALGMLIPQAKRHKDRYFLRAVVSRSGTNGSNFARENQVEILTSNIDDVLRDPDIDMVMIATRHHEHAQQVVRSLAAGKHVFVEKPLAISWSELEDVVHAYRDASRRGELLVGFNRRFSPAIQAVRQRVVARRAPLVIEYRLNAGYLPLDHWVHGAHGGGRNIGEACHMYDVFRFLAGAPAVSITATSIDPGSLPYNRNDNFSATIRYEDGSMATLVYTALGPRTGMGKEHLTVFCDGEALIVDDYKRLTQASDGAVLWQSSEADKGHYEELGQFGAAIAGAAASPIPFEELVETTAVSLHVEDLLFDRVPAGEQQ
jgi:predicted dehydrogenase/threonine dehydrogenase-like Zn-dependent dehydrogenase